MDAEDWRDRVAEAWRVAVQLGGTVEHDIYAEQGRLWLVTGTDDTLRTDEWDSSPGNLAGEPVDCVVIADCHATTVRDTKKAIQALAKHFRPDQVVVTEYPYPPFSPLVETRVMLRGLRLPDSLDEILRVQNLCTDAGMTVHEHAAAAFEAEMLQAANIAQHLSSVDPDEILATTRNHYQRSGRSRYGSPTPPS